MFLGGTLTRVIFLTDCDLLQVTLMLLKTRM